jgi:urease accessory protein
MKRIIALAAFLPTAALAHPGGHFGQPFLDGLTHPFSGADHLLAMVAVEPLILTSILLLGLAAALAFRPPLSLALAGIALFGAAHGFAHGAEGPTQGLALYAAGFVAASATLHALGLTLGLALTPRLTRALGAVTAVAGAALAFA